MGTDDDTTRLHYADLRRFLLFGFGDAAGLENRKEVDGSVYELAQAAIARQLLGVARQDPATRLSGSDRRFMAGGSCAAFVTTGCNIPIFCTAHKQMDIKPIAAPTPGFGWVNLYDPDDALGWPLQPLSPGYAELVDDRAINAGQGVATWILKSWNPLSHTAYWGDAQVLDAVTQRLRAEII